MTGLEVLALRLTHKTAAAVADTVATTIGERLVGQLVEVQDRQFALLGEIRADVQSLLCGPWNTARLLVEQAALPGRSAQERREYLAKAQDRLFDAVPPTRPRFSAGV